MARLPGIDVSYWQPRTPGLRGLAFAFARATYGTSPDKKYAMHMRNFRAARLDAAGAYHFGVGWATPERQVAVFLATARDADLLALDLESDRTKSMTQAQAREFIRLVHRAGRRIGLYHSRSGFPNLGQDWNWVADYTRGARLAGRPLTTKPWTFWQWQGSPLDRNWFNGDLIALRRLAGLEPPAPKPAPDRRVPATVIAKVRGYISRLSAIKRPTKAQVAKLALYRKRLTEYLRRGVR